MRSNRKNPLTFDNRFAPDPLKRYPRSRAVSSVVAPARQKAQAERLAESPHTFRVIVVDEQKDTSSRALQPYAQQGVITLVAPLSLYYSADLRSRYPGKFPRTDGAGLFSAFTFLHRMGDVLLLRGLLTLLEGDGTGLYYLMDTGFIPESAFIPMGKLTDKTKDLGRALRVKCSPKAVGLEPERIHFFVASHTNSEMARRGWVNYDAGGYGQCIADWVALCELPAARARPGRGEPWLLFPPEPTEYPEDMAETLREYAHNINTLFPPFIESLLDDLTGSVFGI